MIEFEISGQKYNVYHAGHIVHVNNLENILSNGLLSYNGVREANLLKEDISMSEVQIRRHTKNLIVEGKQLVLNDNIVGLHDFVSLYFNTKNPMMYVRKHLRNELIILNVEISIVKEKYFLITDGNAGSSSTTFYNKTDSLNKLDAELLVSGNWNSTDENIKRERKRKMCSELLIYPVIEVNWIKDIVCYNDFSKNQVLEIVKKVSPIGSHINVEVDATLFF